ncbi:spermidine hydroxycinnamoyl transferase-like [Rutidosis leptorrhynchoides]|uniref:spermidine hydroxycinnamoyl transferase-like n=1 Tax=Rutidosis leptorrhynchoides TaxID=125765 RepID=UPI003A993591
MKVTKNSSCMVKPAERTWSGRLSLSELDQTGMTTHVPIVYFYTQPSVNWNNVIQKLKTSLTTTLVNFYPLAGRLVSISGGRLELICNGAGVQFTEANTDVRLADLDNFSDHPIIDQLIPSFDYRRTPIEEMPLLLLQVTRFVCGGWSLGFFISHIAVDGQSSLHFITEWTKVCRGEPLGPPPYLDRKVLRAGAPAMMTTRFNNNVEQHYAQFSPPPTLIGQSNNENERRKETAITMLKLTDTLVTKLRNKANENRKNKADRGFTRYEAVTAHIWQTACKIRNHEPEQKTSVGLCIDLRHRMNPPLPENYFGNAIVDVITKGTSGELVSETLGYVCSKIRDTIEKVDDQFVNSVIDFLKNQEDISKFQDLQLVNDCEGAFYGNPNLGVISWLTLSMYGFDFGWGKEIFTGPGTIDAEDGDFLILPSRREEDGSLIVASCLQVKHMEDFKRVFFQSIEED